MKRYNAFSWAPSLSRFSRVKLQKLGINEDVVDSISEKANQLPNLQLLEGAMNNENRATMPSDWLEKHCPDTSIRQHYIDKNLLGDLPEDLHDFDGFFAARRDLLRAKINDLLCASTANVVGVVDLD